MKTILQIQLWGIFMKFNNGNSKNQKFQQLNIKIINLDEQRSANTATNLSEWNKKSIRLQINS